MRHSATHRGRAVPLLQTTVVPSLRQPAADHSAARITEAEVAKNFAAAVLPFSKDDLSDLSGRSVEAAKLWKRAKRAPNSSSLITIARQLRPVRDWLISEIDQPAPVDENPGEALKLVIVGLQMAAQLPGEQGAQARAMLQQLTLAARR